MAPTYSSPQPSQLTRPQVERLSESVAAQLEFLPGADLAPVVDKLGGRIQYKHFHHLDDSDSGSLLVHAESNFDIFLSYSTSSTRDRFTIAHEIGHYVLHYLLARQKTGKPETLEATRYGSDKSEWEANWFAAGFLMPREQFSERFNENGGDYIAVSDEFGVSASAAVVRAKVLGLNR